MAFRIACDLDGTLADMETALQREAEALFGPDVDLRAGSSIPLVPLRLPADFAGEPDSPPGTEISAATESSPAASELSPRRPLTSKERRQLWAHVGQIDNFWQSLGEIEPGAVARLAALVDMERWQVLFVTQRPEGAGATAQMQTQRWLRAYGFEFPSVFVMSGSRGKLADALNLDAVIDDRPDNCLDVVTDSNAHAVLVWRDEAANIPPGASHAGITVTYSFGEALDHLEKIAAVRQRQAGGLMGRIRNAIGI
jgi:hypothetical protein